MNDAEVVAWIKQKIIEETQEQERYEERLREYNLSIEPAGSTCLLGQQDDSSASPPPSHPRDAFQSDSLYDDAGWVDWALVSADIDKQN